MPKERIPLRIVEDRLQLIALICCPGLRIRYATISFVIDTGSPASYFSEGDVKRSQIPLKGKRGTGRVNIGGSGYETIKLPSMEMIMLKEGLKEHFSRKINLSALQTTKSSPSQIIVAQSIPSLLGIDFLREQNSSLFVNVREGIAYLEFDLNEIVPSSKEVSRLPE